MGNDPSRSLVALVDDRSEESMLSLLRLQYSRGSCFSFTVRERFILEDVGELVKEFEFDTFLSKLLVLLCVYSKHRQRAVFPEHFVVRVLDYFGNDFGTLRKRESVHYLREGGKPQNVISINVSRGTISDEISSTHAIRVTEARFEQELKRMGRDSERLKSYVHTYKKIARLDKGDVDDLTSTVTGATSVYGGDLDPDEDLSFLGNM